MEMKYTAMFLNRNSPLEMYVELPHLMSAKKIVLNFFSEVHRSKIISQDVMTVKRQ